MNDTPKISVIVPMYNAEKYLRTCIDSILAQTFTDFELLLIDDCSTDSTLEIAKSYSDPRIKIFQTEENSGSPGIPRNVGIDAARGDFLYFMDNDDAITIHALKILLDKITETGADIVYCTTWMLPDNQDFTSLNNVTGTTMKTSSEPVSKNLKLRVWFELCKNYMNSVMWLCLYRKELFNGAEKIRFNKYLAEDVFVHFDLLCKTYNIVKIDQPFYIYRTNQKSLTHSKKNIVKAIESTFALISHVRAKLSARIDDKRYISQVCLSLLNGVSSIYLQPLYQESPVEMLQELEEFCQKRPEAKAADFAMIFYGYLWGQAEAIKSSNFKKSLQILMDENP